MFGLHMLISYLCSEYKVLRIFAIKFNKLVLMVTFVKIFIGTNIYRAYMVVTYLDDYLKKGSLITSSRL